MLKRKKDGSFLISSESDAVLARERIDRLTKEVFALAKKVGIPAKLEEQSSLQSSLDAWVVEKRAKIETPTWLGTFTQSHTKVWDIDALRKRLPTSVYKLIIKVSVDKDKLDELTKEGTIKLEAIEDCLIVKPSKPYVKWTKRSQDAHEAGEDEAAKLAEMLS